MVQPILLSLSVLLFFAIFWIMNLEWYKSEFLYGTFSHAMKDPLTYLGLLMLLGLVYLCEKAVPLFSGKMKALD